eukprot:6580715-Alexandrium_andersonii.AAC.1
MPSKPGAPHANARELLKLDSEAPQSNPGGSAIPTQEFRRRRSGAPHSSAREVLKLDSEAPKSYPGGSAVQAREFRSRNSGAPHPTLGSFRSQARKFRNP